MEQEQRDQLRKKIKIWSTIIFLVACAIFLRQIANQNISSVAEFQAYIKSFGVVGPLVLTLFQFVQVMIPMLPGYIGCAAGAATFGTVVGFLCNYIGITVGSIVAYFIARKYGMDIILTLFTEKQYNKWSAKVKEARSYDVFLFVATLLPLFPDDFLCYFSGMMKMNTKRFIWIIILGKPWCILAYSIIFGMVK